MAIKAQLRRAIESLPGYDPIRNRFNRFRQQRKMARWIKRGKPLPPPHLHKQRVLLEYATKYKLRLLVETGTYRGDMVEAMKRHFDRIYSIELSPEYYQGAVRRFRQSPQVQLIHGDSRQVLPELMRAIDQPALFWLDGHYSGGKTAKGASDTPIGAELRHIFQAPIQGHVMIIDDAHLFGVDPDYPSLQDLAEFVGAQNNRYHMEVQDNSIRITPR